MVCPGCQARCYPKQPTCAPKSTQTNYKQFCLPCDLLLSCHSVLKYFGILIDIEFLLVALLVVAGVCIKEMQVDGQNAYISGCLNND